MKPKKVYTTFQISRFCSVDITTIMEWIDAGKLKAFKTPGGHRRVLQRDLLSFLHEYKMPVPPELQKFGLRVLVVDDDTSVLRFMTRSIKKTCAQVEIEEALDGFTAGRKLETFVPDLVVLDLYLPGVDGFQVCKNIRKADTTKDVKILAVTGRDTEENRKKIMRCGANDYIAKPFTTEEFSDKVAKLLAIKV